MGAFAFRSSRIAGRASAVRMQPNRLNRGAQALTKKTSFSAVGAGSRTRAFAKAG